MKRNYGPIVVAALAVTGLTSPRPTVAQAQAPVGPPPVPKAFAPGQTFPGVGRFISQVDNFDGVVAVANIQGTGKDNNGNPIQFEVDIRPMQGIYADATGWMHLGTFVFT